MAIKKFIFTHIIADKENLIGAIPGQKVNINFSRRHSVDMQSFAPHNFQYLKIAVCFW